MDLKVFGSSSRGNSYLLSSKESCLFIEAGVPFRKQVMPEINFNIYSVKGILVSHSHGDHSKYLPEYLSYSIPAFASKETIQETGLTKERNFYPVEPDKMFKVDKFTVIPFELDHDVKCFGYLIHHRETGWILFATDTYYIKKKFMGLNHILIEANYDSDILDENVRKGSIPAFVKRRIWGSHMSIQTVQEMLSANDLSKVNNIVLLHLSDGNSDGPLFEDIIQKQTGIPTYIAKPGLKIELNK